MIAATVRVYFQRSEEGGNKFFPTIASDCDEICFPGACRSELARKCKLGIREQARSYSFVGRAQDVPDRVQHHPTPPFTAAFVGHVLCPTYGFSGFSARSIATDSVVVFVIFCIEPSRLVRDRDLPTGIGLLYRRDDALRAGEVIDLRMGSIEQCRHCLPG